MASYWWCRKCGFDGKHHGPDGCSSPFDPFHTTGMPDWVRVKGDAPESGYVEPARPA